MTEPINCDLAELIDRGIYSEDDAIDHIKSASADTVKAAFDSPSLLQLFSHPVLAPLAQQHGYTMFSPGGPSNLYHKLLYEQQLQDKMRAAQMAAQSDRGTYKDMIRGLAAITGQEWSPESAGAADAFAQQIANISPTLMQLNPGLFDRLHGPRGSAALMASRMMDTAQQFGTNPEHAAAVSSIIQRNLSQDPAWASGLSAGDIGSLYQQLYMQGMIPANDPFAAAEVLKASAAPIAVLRELGGQGTLAELEAMAPGLSTQLPGRELALRMREQHALSRGPNLYGPYAGAHQQAMQGASRSRLANQIGATMRLGSVAGFNVDPQQIANMTKPEWLRFMKGHGVTPQQAYQALGSTAANQEFIFRNNVAPLVYAKQRDEIADRMNRFMGKDIGRTIMDLPRNVMLDGRKRTQAISKALGVSPIEAETLWGRANTMLSRNYGKDAWSLNTLYNKGTLDASKQFRDKARSDAALSSYYAGYLPNSPLEGFMSSLQQAGPNTSLADVAAGTFGMVPQANIPQGVFKSSEDKIANLSDMLKGVTDTVALVSMQKETIEKQKEEEEENRRLLKAVDRNKRERKARRLAATQDKLDVMLGKASSHEGIRISNSDIAGLGLFATKDFDPEDIITKAIDVIEKSEEYPWKPEYKQTDACRYTNHERKPNAKLLRDGDVFNLVAVKKIPNGVEITVNYGDATKEMGHGFHYTHNGEEYKTDKSIEDVVLKDTLMDLVEKLSAYKKKKKKKTHT